jgi:hypothetical protein
MTATINDYNIIAAELPINARTELGSGFTAPIMRAYGHILYALAATADEGYTINPDEAIEELSQARYHLNAVHTDENISRTTRRFFQTLQDATGLVTDGYESWADEDRKIVLADLANRFAAFATKLDFEFVGLDSTTADPGLSL